MMMAADLLIIWFFFLGFTFGHSILFVVPSGVRGSHVIIIVEVLLTVMEFY